MYVQKHKKNARYIYLCADECNKCICSQLTLFNEKKRRERKKQTCNKSITNCYEIYCKRSWPLSIALLKNDNLKRPEIICSVFDIFVCIHYV